MKAQCVECGEILSQPIFCFQIFGHGMFQKKGLKLQKVENPCCT